TFTATTTLANPGASRLNSVTLSLTAPAGWTVTATSPTSFATLSSGQTVHTTWQVSAPTTPGNYQLTAQATYQIGTNPGTATNTSAIELLSPSLSGAFDDSGISDDSNTYAGNFDGRGFSDTSAEPVVA